MHYEERCDIKTDNVEGLGRIPMFIADEINFDLPANFDVLNACYRQWLWSKNKSYVNDSSLFTGAGGAVETLSYLPYIFYK